MNKTLEIKTHIALACLVIFILYIFQFTSVPFLKSSFKECNSWLSMLAL